MHRSVFLSLWLRREELVSSWQAWLLLRPLIVFAMAGPFFVFAALLVLRKQSLDGGKSTEPAFVPRFTLCAGGTWRMQASVSQPVPSIDAASTPQKRAA